MEEPITAGQPMTKADAERALERLADEYACGVVGNATDAWLEHLERKMVYVAQVLRMFD